MIQNYDKFSKQNENFDKFAHFKEFIFIQQWLTQKHVIYWGNYMYF
jgi:hypothetical protein